jgi:hypothetical protein
MRALDPTELLSVWERGVGTPPARAVVPLLAAACPEISVEQLARLTIGERDGLLLSQREWLFGPQLEAFDECPACGERLEFTLTVEGLRAVPAVTDAAGLGQVTTRSAEVNGYQIEFRPPTIGDVQGIASLPELLERCVISSTRAGEPASVSELPAPVVEAISEGMAKADPQGETELALSCPACEHEWSATFDIAAFLWEELHRWAQRTLLEVHQLATAYGWREAEILTLSPARRQIYLTMIGERE